MVLLRFFTVLGLAFLPGTMVLAQNAAVKKPSLFDQIADSTLTGRHSGGVTSTEYHALDGRVFGYTNGEPNINACWRTNGQDVICYYYGKGWITGEFCWRFERVASNGYRLTATDGTGATGLFLRESGNPHGLFDNGESWTCDALMSSLTRPLFKKTVNLSGFD